MGVEKTSKITGPLSEDQVIEEAYAVALNPERLEDFELLLETYLDAGHQNSRFYSPPESLLSISNHISRALEILEYMRHTHVTESNAQNIVDSNYGIGFMVNSRGQIIASNSDAIKFMNKATSISSLGLDPDSLSEIQCWIGRSHSPGQKHVRFINVYLDKDETATCLFLTPVDLKALNATDAEAFFLITSVEIGNNPDAAEAIQNIYSLSESEVQIAFQLANGKSPKDISEIRDSSLATVRTQIKHIREKMDCNNTPDVVRKICNMSTRYSSVTSQVNRAVKSFAADDLARVSNLTLRDGRFMEYTEQGHPHGRPVLHIHSLMNGPKQSGLAAQLAVLRKWRFISPSRAGYGNSDRVHHTSIASCLDSTADDMAELIGHLGLKDVIVIGSIYAQRFAFKYPHLVSHYVCVNKVPIWHSDELNQLQRRQRNMIKTSMYAPRLARFPARLAKILMDTGREKVFINGLSSGHDIDMQVLEDPDHFRIIANGFKHSFSQGIDAFVVDVQGYHTDWIQDAKLLQVPVNIVLGSDNKMQTKIGLDRYLEAVPTAKLNVIKGAGIYMPITHFESILDTLDNL